MPGTSGQEQSNPVKLLSIMQIKSLGYRTDLFFPKFEGLIYDRGNYLVVLTPSNPSYYWGNFVLFGDPPSAGDYERWKAIFAREISAKQETHHMVFGWDATDGDTGQIRPFLEAGFSLNQNVVLTARQVILPPKYNQEVEIRPVTGDQEWEEAIQNQITCRKPVFSLAGYSDFKRAQMDRYRRMAKAGLGEWFGAYDHGQLVADLGLFCVDGIARFQSVETHPEHRRRGICGALVYQASRYGLEHMGARLLVMIADEHYFAAKIYESAGFKPAERQVGTEWWERTN
jgi:GNAT superfamily N-acetyltransferase